MMPNDTPFVVAEARHGLRAKAGLLYALLSKTNARQDKCVAEVVGEPGTLREPARTRRTSHHCPAGPVIGPADRCASSPVPGWR